MDADKSGYYSDPCLHVRPETGVESIFLSYRRSDSEGQAGRLFQNLVDHLGRSAVLLDVAGLEKGRDFRKTIDTRLGTCKVMLALIGRGWVSARDDAGARRHPGDPGAGRRCHDAA
jgi:hypothetical protein